ncbi:hypothetical protein BDY21DRAFT_351529, partial [Lineolata rhizophorae]
LHQVVQHWRCCNADFHVHVLHQDFVLLDGQAWLAYPHSNLRLTRVCHKQDPARYTVQHIVHDTMPHCE